MDAARCPNADVWREFTLGRLSVGDGERLATHLDECPECVTTIQALHDEDTLVQAMRASQGSVIEVETELLDEIGVRLRFRAVARSSQEQSTLDAGSKAGESSAETQEHPAHVPAGSQAGQQDVIVPQQLGHYRIVRMLGQGGMGVVLEAEDTHLKRTVALKVMKARIAIRDGARERFLREAQAAAGIEHENIITIYHVAEDNGVVFAAMPLLKGESLEEILKSKTRLPINEALRVTREIAAGLAAAHERGLIHRDIKPGNIWIEPGTGRVKILDFGLARPIHGQPLSEGSLSTSTVADSEKTVLASAPATATEVTRQGAIVGTPSYMAPEQARAQPLDGRCDLFSLGCVLYRMCTGAMPFIGGDTMSTLLAVSFQEPKKARQLDPAIPAQVEAIVMKLLAKKPEERFQSARDVVTAVRAVERGISRRKLVRRMAGPVVAALLLLTLSIGYFQGATIKRLAMNRGEVVLESADPNIDVLIKVSNETAAMLKPGATIELPAGEYRAELGDKSGNLALVTDQFQLERNGKVVVQVRNVMPGKVTFQGDDLPLRVVLKQDGKLVRTIKVDKTANEKLLPGHYDLELVDGPGRLKLTPHGINISAGEAANVRLRASGEWRQFDSHGAAVWSVAAARNLALTGSSDRTLSVWNLDTGAEVHRLKAKKPVATVAISADAGFALSAGGKDPKPDFNVYLWDIARETAEPLSGHASLVTSVAFSPDGTKAVSGSVDGSLLLWDIKTRQLEKRFAGHADGILGIAFAPHGNQVATAAGDDGVGVWDIFTGQRVVTLAGKADGVRCVAYSPDGQRVVTGGFDNAVRLWDLATQKELHRFTGHANWVTSVAFSPDSKRVISGSADKTVRVWDIDGQTELVRFDGHDGPVQSVAFAADGRHVLSASLDKSVRMWKLP